MACRQRHELLAPAVEERIGADDERAGMQLRRGSRRRRRSRFRCSAFRIWSCTPFARAASCTSRDDALGTRIVRVHEQGDHPGLGNQLGQQLEPLGHQLGGQDADAREVAARPGETGDQARLRPGRCRRRRRSGSSRSHFSPLVPQRAAVVDDHVDLAADEIGGQCGQPIIAALRPAVFDRHVLSLDIAGFAQSLAERGHGRCSRAGRAGCRGSRSPASPSAARAGRAPRSPRRPAASISSRRLIR